MSSLCVLRFGYDSVWIPVFKPRHNLRVQEVNPIQLVAERYPGRRFQKAKHDVLKPQTTVLHQKVFLPVGLDVVGSSEQLDLPGAGREPLDHAVDLVWFVTGGADLSQGVQTLRR